MSLSIRPAVPADAAALGSIYAQYIDTAVTFEYTLPDAAAFAARIADIVQRYPYLVCMRDGTAIGYAYAHVYRTRAAYQWDAELSVYVDRACLHQGIGRRLYGALLALLALQGVRTAYGCVTLPNPASEALHTALGFARAGVLHRAGWKNDHWHDVVWFERALTDRTDAPAPVIPFPALPGGAVRAVLDDFSQGEVYDH